MQRISIEAGLCNLSVYGFPDGKNKLHSRNVEYVISDSGARTLVRLNGVAKHSLWAGNSNIQHHVFWGTQLHSEETASACRCRDPIRFEALSGLSATGEQKLSRRCR